MRGTSRRIPGCLLVPCVFLGCTLSGSERLEIESYLSCDDCVTWSRDSVVDMGWRAIPRLEGALVGPHTSREAFIRENAERAHRYAGLPDAGGREAAFGQAMAQAYRSSYQARAAVAITDIAARPTNVACLFRPEWPLFRTCWEQAEQALDIALADTTDRYSPNVRRVLTRERGEIGLYRTESGSVRWDGMDYLMAGVLALFGVTASISLLTRG